MTESSETERERLVAAVKAGDGSVISSLLRSRPDLVDAHVEDAPSLLLLAVYYGHPEVAELLVEHGAEVDIFDACALGKLSRVEQLLARNPGLVNSYNRDGFQPLGLASFFGHPAVVALLLVRGAEVNSASRNAQQVMPLHSAVAARSIPVTRALLESGADVDARQQGGFTPLHAAAQNGQTDMVELLLGSGADPTAASADGATPPDLAGRAGYAELAERLRRAGGRESDGQ